MTQAGQFSADRTAPPSTLDLVGGLEPLVEQPLSELVIEPVNLVALFQPRVARLGGAFEDIEAALPVVGPDDAAEAISCSCMPSAAQIRQLGSLL
jgi:hypothetical protein